MQLLTKDALLEGGRAANSVIETVVGSLNLRLFPNITRGIAQIFKYYYQSSKRYVKMIGFYNFSALITTTCWIFSTDIHNILLK